MLSIPHMIVLFVIVLVVFGPHKLPELAKGLGKLMAEFRKASTDFKSAFEQEMRDLERQARDVERRKAEVATASALPQPATLATPSGSETQPAPSELADTEGDSRATEGSETLSVTPVPEAVPRIDDAPADAAAHDTSTESPSDPHWSSASGNGSSPEHAPDSSSPDISNDRKPAA